MTGGETVPPLRPILLAGLGSTLAVACVTWLHSHTGTAWLLGSFGASSVLLFGFPDASFSQPRNLFAGHLLSTFIGLSFLTLLGPVWWAVPLAVGAALMGMMATRTVHPPAGSNPVIILLAQPDWSFLLFPTLAGATVLWLLARAYVRMTSASKAQGLPAQNRSAGSP